MQVDQDDFQLKWLTEHSYFFFLTVFVMVLEPREEHSKQITIVFKAIMATLLNLKVKRCNHWLFLYLVMSWVFSCFFFFF